MSHRHVNRAGLRLIKRFEGFRADAYKPVPGERWWTIGFGHYGPDVKPGSHITREQGEEILKRDLFKFEQAVSRLVTTRINDNRFAALVAFAFNVGVGAFENSTLLRLVNRRRFGLAALQFAVWVRGAGGVRLLGLVRRRAAEAALFVKRPKESA